jgi:hypothetical protein
MDFLKYLRLSGVKAAYRQKALETHPDRALIIGADPSSLIQKFRMTTDAYEKLRAFVTGIETVEVTLPYGHTTHSPCRPTPKPRPKTHTVFRDDFFFNGMVPQRKLLFGQYLFYYGRVSWRTFISAITWQKLERPPIGRLAVINGLLSPIHVQEILRLRLQHEKFGQSAIRLGYLNRAQLLMILERQRRMQHLFGQYFLQKGVLTQSELFKCLVGQRSHNRSQP